MRRITWATTRFWSLCRRRGLVFWAVLIVGAVAGPPAHAMQLAAGSYTGNGMANRVVTGMGFRPDAVIVKGDAAQPAVMRTTTMAGDATKALVEGIALQPNRIQSLEADGFTVGAHGEVNGSGISYSWVAFRADGAEDFQVGSYAGNGSDNRPIAGVGFQPSYVIVMSAGPQRAVHRSSAMAGDVSFAFADAGAKPNYIQTLQVDGFQVGSDAQVNAVGTTYHYLAWKAVAGSMGVGSYVGDGTDRRTIAGTGFQPDYLIIKAEVKETGVHRTAAMSGERALTFNAESSVPNAIQATTSDGFRVGTAKSVNEHKTKYFWAAFRATTPMPAPDRLAITSLNDGVNPSAGIGFPIVVTTRDAAGISRNVTYPTTVSLSLKTGSGALGGTLTGTIPAGASAVTISGVTYTRAEDGIVLTSSRTSGDALTSGDSAPFTVDPGTTTSYDVTLASPQSAGITFAVTVTARDRLGNVVTTDSATVVTLTSASGHVIFDGNVDGLFGDNARALNAGTVRMDGKGSVAETTTVTATDAQGATGSTSLTVTAGTASTLSFTTQPGNATAGLPIPGPPTVAVQDTFGNTIVPSMATITLALGVNPAGSIVAGKTSKSASGGIASFDDLTISNPGSGYTLIASAPSLTQATSTAFTVSAATGALSGTVAAASDGHPLGGAKVEVVQTGLVKASATTSADGTYSMSGLTPGSYEVRASASGYQPGTQAITIDAGHTALANFSLAPVPGLAIRITTPATGSTVSEPWIVVQGEISGSSGACAVTLTTSIVIEGEATDVAVPVEVNGTRFAARVGLLPGDVPLTARATDQAGQVAQDAVTVTFQPDDPEEDRAILPDVFPTVGFAPLIVTFGGAAAADPSVTALDLDADGDGQPDFNLASFASPPHQVTYTYQTEGLYIATMVVRDQAGRSSTVQVPINVIAVPDLPAIWDQFRGALGLGDVDATVEFVGIEARDRYRDALDSLGTADLASIAADLGAITVHYITPAYATASIVRVHDGVAEGFVIHFMRDADGIWRIVSM